jgi:hypothetical protein
METNKTPIADSLDKEVETQSVRSTATSGRNDGDFERPPLMAEKDIESCRVATNIPQDTEVNGTGLATRISTKSSWIDPGPPPDGGTVAWTQGAYSPSFVCIDFGQV